MGRGGPSEPGSPVPAPEKLGVGGQTAGSGWTGFPRNMGSGDSDLREPRGASQRGGPSLSVRAWLFLRSPLILQSQTKGEAEVLALPLTR